MNLILILVMTYLAIVHGIEDKLFPKAVFYREDTTNIDKHFNVFKQTHKKIYPNSQHESYR